MCTALSSALTNYYLLTKRWGWVWFIKNSVNSLVWEHHRMTANTPWGLISQGRWVFQDDFNTILMQKNLKQKFLKIMSQIPGTLFQLTWTTSKKLHGLRVGCSFRFISTSRIIFMIIIMHKCVPTAVTSTVRGPMSYFALIHCWVEGLISLLQWKLLYRDTCHHFFHRFLCQNVQWAY